MPQDTPAQPAPSYEAYLVCVAGPDHGKRVGLARAPLLAGRSPDSNLLCDDPDVADRFATLQFDGHNVHIDALGDVAPFVDGHPVGHGTMKPGQQLRLGRSTWQFETRATAPSVREFVNRLGDQLSSVAGIEKPKEWKAGEMFSDVTKTHSDEDIETYLAVGTRATTPPLADVDAHWPKPWMFVRVFVPSVVVYALFAYAWEHFQNDNMLPGLIITGSAAIPLSLLVFFFEVNVPRNISLYQILKLLVAGGIVSIVLSLFFFDLTHLDNWLGASSAGIIEESGKALTLLLVVKRPRFRWTLNGLLLGATVGTGFAIFESAGYALRNGLSSGAGAMFQTIMQRGVLSVLGGHILWTGLVGAALWRVRGDRPFRNEMLIDPRFLRVLFICMAMHMIWNSPLEFLGYGKELVLGAAAWLLILGMIQDGLKQVREAQAAAAA
jgi:protease PrsW